MKKFKIVSKPTRMSDLSFDDLYDEMSSDWELKAERLQNRRWKQPRQQLY
jgi:hypothetical protein